MVPGLLAAAVTWWHSGRADQVPGQGGPVAGLCPLRFDAEPAVVPAWPGADNCSHFPGPLRVLVAMSRRFHLGVRWAAAGLIAILLAVGVAAQPREPTATAAPFRLVPLKPDGIPAALAQVEQGTLVRHPAGDSELLAGRRRKPVPRQPSSRRGIAPG